MVKTWIFRLANDRVELPRYQPEIFSLRAIIVNPVPLSSLNAMHNSLPIYHWSNLSQPIKHSSTPHGFHLCTTQFSGSWVTLMALLRFIYLFSSLSLIIAILFDFDTNFLYVRRPVPYFWEHYLVYHYANIFRLKLLLFRRWNPLRSVFTLSQSD